MFYGHSLPGQPESKWQTLDAHHSGSAHAVSMLLLPEEEVRALMAPYLDVDVVISDDRMYQVCSVKRA